MRQIENIIEKHAKGDSGTRLIVQKIKIKTVVNLVHLELFRNKMT